MIPSCAILVLRAEVEAEPLFSWRPVARALGRRPAGRREIVFEAPSEYQIVGGLVFYLRTAGDAARAAGRLHAARPTSTAQMQGMFLGGPSSTVVGARATGSRSSATRSGAATRADGLVPGAVSTFSTASVIDGY